MGNREEREYRERERKKIGCEKWETERRESTEKEREKK